MNRIGDYGEIAPSKAPYGTPSISPLRLEGLTYNSADKSLSAIKAMKFVTTLQNQGVTKDVFFFPIRNWVVSFTNLTEDLLLELYDKNTGIMTNITVTKGKITTFAWAIELRKGVFGSSGSNPIVGESIIFLGGINAPLCYLDDDKTIKNWRVLTNYHETNRYITPIVEDIDIFQNRLSILVPKALGSTLFREDEVGTDSPWIYLSVTNVFDNFRQTGGVTDSVHVKPQNFETNKFYSITAFRNILGVIHSGGLSVIKSGSPSGNEALSQGNLLYYLADESEALPIKSFGFNNVLMYLSRTGLRGRTLLEDPLTNQMTGFKIPIASQRFTQTPTRLFKRISVSQLCIFDGSTLFSFCEMVTTDKGGQLFPRTTYIKSNDYFKVLAINDSAAVLEIGGNRFAVEDYSNGVLSLGVIENYYPTAVVLGHGDDWIELDIDEGLQTIMVLLDYAWYKLIRSEGGKFLCGSLLPQDMGPTVQLIPLEGKGVMSLLPPPMRTSFYQWEFILNDDTVVITGDDVAIALNDNNILVASSTICAYSYPMTLELMSTTVQYGPYNAQDVYIIADRDVEAVGRFNHTPKIQQYIPGIPAEYSFTVSFSPQNRIFSLQITPTLSQTDTLVLEQICFLA